MEMRNGSMTPIPPSPRPLPSEPSMDGHGIKDSYYHIKWRAILQKVEEELMRMEGLRVHEGQSEKCLSVRDGNNILPLAREDISGAPFCSRGKTILPYESVEKKGEHKGRVPIVIAGHGAAGRWKEEEKHLPLKKRTIIIYQYDQEVQDKDKALQLKKRRFYTYNQVENKQVEYEEGEQEKRCCEVINKLDGNQEHYEESKRDFLGEEIFSIEDDIIHEENYKEGEVKDCNDKHFEDEENEEEKKDHEDENFEVGEDMNYEGEPLEEGKDLRTQIANPEEVNYMQEDDYGENMAIHMNHVTNPINLITEENETNHTMGVPLTTEDEIPIVNTTPSDADGVEVDDVAISSRDVEDGVILEGEEVDGEMPMVEFKTVGLVTKPRSKGGRKPRTTYATTTANNTIAAPSEYKRVEEDLYSKVKRRRDRLARESRYTQVNGKGSKCIKPTRVGYSFCDHHLALPEGLQSIQNKSGLEFEEKTEVEIVSMGEKRGRTMMKFRSLKSVYEQSIVIQLPGIK